MAYSFLHRYGRTTSFYRRQIAFTIGTGTDGQGFQGLPHALGITLTTCFTKGFYTFTDGVFISPSVRTDNLALPTVSCLYHRYRRYQWTRFSKATSCPWTKANYLFHQTILHIHRWCIHFSIGTDEQPRFTDGNLRTKVTVGMLATVLDNPGSDTSSK